MRAEWAYQLRPSPGRVPALQQPSGGSERSKLVDGGARGREGERREGRREHSVEIVCRSDACADVRVEVRAHAIGDESRNIVDQGRVERRVCMAGGERVD